MSNYSGSSEEAMNIVRVMGLQDKRIRDLEGQIEFLTKTLKIIAESEKYRGMAWDNLRHEEGKR